jgi:hypothetical protein
MLPVLIMMVALAVLLAIWPQQPPVHAFLLETLPKETYFHANLQMHQEQTHTLIQF